MSEVAIKKEDIESVEGKHVIYCPPRSGRGDDLHVVKEWVTTKSGERKPRLRFIRNFTRDYYITKPAFRDHEQKKEWERLDRLDRFTSREFELINSVSNTLGLYRPPYSKRQLCRNQYIYGIDVSSCSIIKQRYIDGQARLNVKSAPSTVAGLDTETDMVHGHKKILMTGISYKNKAFTAIVRDFIPEFPDAPERLQKLAMKYIPEIMTNRKIEWEIIIVDKPSDTVVEAFKRLHEWKPDWVSVWNVEFDYLKMQEALDDDGIDIAQVFSDPSIPDDFKFFTYHKGSTQKRTEEGKLTPIPPHQRWDTLEFPATFQMIDGMQAYDKIRTGSPAETSYSLDAITGINKLGYQKLRFEEDAHLVGGSPEWHEFMQRHHKLRYILYNLFDNILLELLDERTKDLADTLNTFAQSSDLINFRSQPRRKVDELHFDFLKTKGLVMGTTSDNLTDDLDKEIYGLGGWIVTLPAHLIANNGLPVLKGAPEILTNAYIYVYDLDVSSSYPNTGAACNLSKMTTVAEIIGSPMHDEETLRMQGMNFVFGHVNAVEVATTLFDLPNLMELSDMYDRDHGLEPLYS